MATRPYQTTIEPLSSVNRPDVRALLTSARNTHVHLDWRSLTERLTDANLICQVARRTRIPRLSSVVACLGAVTGASQAGPAWLRLAACLGAAGREALDQSWSQLQSGLRERGIPTLAVLPQNTWLEKYLRAWSFSQANTVITLVHQGNYRPATPPVASQVNLRQASHEDLAAIARVDAAAFEPLWQHAQIDLQHAYAVAAIVQVAERGGTIVGYQLSTQHATGGHLARLAVDPAFQHQGIGASLVSGALSFFNERGVREVSVNTQQDNLVSQSLYGRMGFEPTGHAVPIWTYRLSA